MNVISDIAGQYKAFRALLKKMPDQETLSVGDMIDRGPDSKKVVDWFMNHGTALLGNHEHMMVDWVFNGRDYNKTIWSMNGGNATLTSYGFVEGESPPFFMLKAAEWMRKLPLKWENKDYFISHTFQRHFYGFSDYIQDPKPEVWSRKHPVLSDKIQIAGHNAQWGLRYFMSNNNDDFGAFIYALSIDTSAMNQICGVDLTNMNIFVQDYIK